MSYAHHKHAFRAGTLDHGSFIIWLSIDCYNMQDLIFAFDAQPDLIFESAIEPSLSTVIQD